MSSNLGYEKLILPSIENSLLGRTESMPIPEQHYVNKNNSCGLLPEGFQEVYLGMGCFWGVERLFWNVPGVWVTAVGYAGGLTPNPSYEEVCSGLTGHTEVVLVVFDSEKITLLELLKIFWEHHNPTQGMRQGNDVGSPYRSAIYVANENDKKIAQESLAHYQIKLWQQQLTGITTEIKTDQIFYYAEGYHQQYLAKNSAGYCNLQSAEQSGYPAFD